MLWGSGGMGIVEEDANLDEAGAEGELRWVGRKRRGLFWGCLVFGVHSSALDWKLRRMPCPT